MIKTYEFQWEEKAQRSVIIKADNKQEAFKKWLEKDYDKADYDDQDYLDNKVIVNGIEHFISTRNEAV